MLIVCQLCATCVPVVCQIWHTTGTQVAHLKKRVLIFVICLENINAVHISYGAVKYELLIPTRSLVPA